MGKGTASALNEELHPQREVVGEMGKGTASALNEELHPQREVVGEMF